jgi:hypothetical protein
MAKRASKSMQMPTDVGAAIFILMMILLIFTVGTNLLLKDTIGPVSRWKFFVLSTFVGGIATTAISDYVGLTVFV